MSSTIVAVATLVGALTAMVAALGGVIVAWRNSKKADDAREKAAVAAAAAQAAKQAAEDMKKEVILTKDGVFEVGKQIDGRLSALLELTKQASLAEGRLEGIASQKAAQSSRADSRREGAAQQKEITEKENHK